MLIVDPKKRATVDDLLKDPWLSSQHSNASALATVSELKKHLAVTRLKAAGNVTIAANRMQHMAEKP